MFVQIGRITATFTVLVFLSMNVYAHDKVVIIPLSGDDLKPLQNIITVAKSNGDFVSPVAAINSITDASASNPYLIVIGPGVYILTETLQMKEYVDIAGSGEVVTKITGAISAPSIFDSMVVDGANNAALRDLTIENTGGGAQSIAIFNSATSPSLKNLTIIATGGLSNNLGVNNLSASSPAMMNLTITVSDGPTNIGVNNFVSSPAMTNLMITASGGDLNFGVFNNSTSSPLMVDLMVTAVGGSSDNYGVINAANSSPIIRGSYLSGDTSGLRNNTPSSHPNVSQSTVVNGASGTGSICTFVDDGLGNVLDGSCFSLIF